MSRPARAVLLAFLAVAALFQLPSAPAESATTDAMLCPELRHLDGIGDVCPRGTGLFELYAPDGSSLGFTHGGDAACQDCDEPLSVNSGTTPYCVSAAPNTYYVHVIYARASNDVDRYSSIVSTIRTLVGNANNMVDQAGQATGAGMDIRVLCDSGVVRVENAVLPTSMSSDSFSTIVNDLKGLGYNDTKQKYWVWYDDNTTCGCAGTGHVYMDESPGVSNLNNGNGVPMMAVNFGYVSTRTWLHELGHNLGAVQDSAPYSTQAGHCIDGRDTMCYNDGGPNGGNYSTSYCATEVFDCNKNTYCHASPASGSWLATHWNVCGSVNRFLQRSGVNVAPVMEALSCTPANPNEGQTVTCSFRATDPGNNISYSVSWGDGSAVERHPTSGHVASNTTRTATHAYATSGSYTVTVNATDDQTPALTSAARTQVITVAHVNTAPTVSVSCPSASVQPGASVACTVNSTDDSTGVRYTIAWGDGSTSQVPSASTWAAPGVARSVNHTYTSLGNFSVNVTATDNATTPLTSSVATATVRVANNAPVMQSLSCTTAVLRPNDPATCTFQASDDSSGVRYTVEWGDGQTTQVPGATTWATPGTTRNATHAYTAAGNYTVRVTAMDNVTPSATSAARTTTVRVEADSTAPTLTLTDPAAGYLYSGCSLKQAKGTTNVLFVQRGCVRATATDASGVARLEVRYQGQLLAEDRLGPYEMEFMVPDTGLGLSYQVLAYDTRGNVRSVTFLADSLGT